MITKPIVHYKGEAPIAPWLWNPECMVAYLDEVLDHPRLGKCYEVTTSKIVTFPDKDGTFETRNTIYKRVVE
jgi:hypothetical protein